MERGIFKPREQLEQSKQENVIVHEMFGKELMVQCYQKKGLILYIENPKDATQKKPTRSDK